MYVDVILGGPCCDEPSSHSGGAYSRGPAQASPDTTIPLLPLAPEEGSGENSSVSWSQYATEASRLARIAAPISLQSASSFAMTLVAVAFAGRLGRLALSQALLASSCYNVTGISVLVGLAQGMETPAGQAYGSKQYRVVGVVLQRALLICLTVFAAIQLLWTKMPALLLLAGQPEELVGGACAYLQLLGPALLFTTLNECINRYLLAQGVASPQMGSMYLATALSPVYMWLLVFRMGLGVHGTALGIGAVQVTALAATLLYIVFRESSLRGTPKQTWHGWSWDCLRGWFPILKLAVPSVAGVCLEWWLYEGLVLIAGWLTYPDIAISVMGIGFNTTCLTYSVSGGIAAAASTRVANALGAGNPEGARRAAHVAISLEVAIMGSFWFLGLALRHAWGRLFTDDPQVLSLLASMLPIILFSELGAGLNCACGGILRGAGRQARGTILNLLSYWVFGLPLILVLAAPWGPLRWGVTGLWAGLTTATSMQGAAMCIVVACLNWRKEAFRAAALVREHVDTLETSYLTGLRQPLLTHAAEE